MDRRRFLMNGGLLTGGFYTQTLQAIAGPFSAEELLHNIPADKKLDPDWVRGLARRGQVTRYLLSRNELTYIGMPVGGLQCGTVYLGGDGRLWLWDIFNSQQEGIEPKTVDWHSEVHAGRKVRSRDGSAYVAPAAGIRPVEQGFAFRIRRGGQTIVKRTDVADWDEIVFEATYPMALIRYIDTSLELDISAEVFSPFIPLDEQDSALPCTIHSFQFRNRGRAAVSVDIIGWLENRSCHHSAQQGELRENRIRQTGVPGSVICTHTGEGPEIISRSDHGTLAIAGLTGSCQGMTDVQLPVNSSSFDAQGPAIRQKTIGEPLISGVRQQLDISAGASVSADFCTAWHFPNLRLKGLSDEGRHYAVRFRDAGEVTDYVHTHHQRLTTLTRTWKRTWYNSTLPWWFLERSFLNISSMATTMAHRFASGRSYGWEGVGCCPGTCTHVWQYAQALGRIFPAIERDTRTRVDLGLAWEPDGMIRYRGEFAKGGAIDGQAGTILRIWREHTMCADDRFLRRHWAQTKRSIEWMMRQDRNLDGMEDTPLENTLDAKWDGEIAWIVGLCLAAAAAGEAMAREMGDLSFASTCGDYLSKGRKNMEEHLFNGEYFIHRPDPEKGRSRLGSYNTCHIDQVYGQAWAFQAGLPRVLDQHKTITALRSLWKYNFAPDVGPYIKQRKGGRPYALPGEGGLVMNTNPANETRPYGENVTWQLGYFHECMSGFEHQVAAHMMAEGMIDEALVITRMIHDRYHAAKRNPFNEIECSDHYARAMASHGTFLSACGYEYHGPNGYLRFAPAFRSDDFRAAFTSAEGWGSFSQLRKGKQLTAGITLAYGSLRLQRLSLVADPGITRVRADIDGKRINTTRDDRNGRFELLFPQPIRIESGQQLNIRLT